MGQRHLGRTHVWIFFVSLLVPCCTVFRGAPAQEVKQIKPDKSFVVGLKGLSAGGLAFDGKSLWVSAQSVRVPDRLLRYNLEGKLLSSVPIPDAANSAGGLAYDGKAIYLLDYATRFAEGKILRLDKQGKTLDAVPLPKEQKNT